jgi:hypothetical protein
MDSNHCNSWFIRFFNGNLCNKKGYCLSKEAFDEWGWRVPFSIIMVFVSYLIFVKTWTNAVLLKAKAEGKTSTNP